MKTGTFVLTALLAVIYADNAVADRGHSSRRSSGHSGAKTSTPAHAHIAHPAHVPHSYVHAPAPRTRIVAAPFVIYRSAPVFYVPPVYPSGSFFSPPVVNVPQYQPPATEYVEQPPSIAQAPQYQYFCPDTRLYYPATTECASGWLKVVPDSGTIR